MSGGANGVRTRDLIVANDALSQLSYSPTGLTIIGASPFKDKCLVEGMEGPLEEVSYPA